MRRAISAAQQRSHRYVTLEHLLLALIDDPDALALLNAARTDVVAMRGAVIETVTHNLATLYTPGAFDLRASYKVERVLQSASDDARRMGCTEVDAAFVAVALFHETDSAAYDLLKRHNFMFHAAMTWIGRNRGAAEAKQPAPTPQPGPERYAEEAEDLDEHVFDEEHIFDDEQILDDELTEEENEVWRRQPPTPSRAPERQPYPQGEASEGRPQPSPPPPQAAPRVGWEIGPAPSRAEAKPASGPGAERSLGKPVLSRNGQAGNRNASGERAGSLHEALRNGREGSDRQDAAPAAPPANGASREERSNASAGSQPADPSTARRLDDMRPRQARAPEAPATPAPRGAEKRKAAAQADKSSSDKTGRARKKLPPPPLSPGAVYAGKLAENIPRSMRAHKTALVELRIAREETEAFVSGFEGNAEPLSHDIIVTQAMSVMLRAPDGGFLIENLAPETQWIFNRPGAATQESFGRWRWSITPNETGERKLQLVVSARSVDQNGLAGDTVLPDQIITVHVSVNYLRTIAQAFKWAGLMLLGGLITEITLIVLRRMGAE